MIKSIASKGTQDIWLGLSTKAARKTLPMALHGRAVELLNQLHAAVAVEFMRVPPGNRLHKLHGDMANLWSVSIDMQFRLVFEFSDGNAHQVRIVDYH